MKLMRLLLFLLAVSLVLQNTCPYGYAAKTAFVAPLTHDCPMNKSHHSPSKERGSVDDNQGKALYPLFVFSVPDSRTVISSFQTHAEYTALSSGNYKDHFREPSIQPPVA
ncbi:MAG: hypothetical protein HZA16_11550 [Nitrospirae bacterium]|nr:hypothetical protein [Nitrospirota bacterium]